MWYSRILPLAAVGYVSITVAFASPLPTVDGVQMVAPQDECLLPDIINPGCIVPDCSLPKIPHPDCGHDGSYHHHHSPSSSSSTESDQPGYAPYPTIPFVPSVPSSTSSTRSREPGYAPYAPYSTPPSVSSSTSSTESSSSTESEKPGYAPYPTVPFVPSVPSYTSSTESISSTESEGPAYAPYPTVPLISSVPLSASSTGSLLPTEGLPSTYSEVPSYAPYPTVAISSSVPSSSLSIQTLSSISPTIASPTGYDSLPSILSTVSSSSSPFSSTAAASSTNGYGNPFAPYPPYTPSFSSGLSSTGESISTSIPSIHPSYPIVNNASTTASPPTETNSISTFPLSIFTPPVPAAPTGNNTSIATISTEGSSPTSSTSYCSTLTITLTINPSTEVSSEQASPTDEPGFPYAPYPNYRNATTFTTSSFQASSQPSATGGYGYPYAPYPTYRNASTTAGPTGTEVLSSTVPRASSQQSSATGGSGYPYAPYPAYHNASTTASPTGTVGLPSTSSYPPYPTFNNASTTTGPTSIGGLSSTLTRASPQQSSATGEYGYPNAPYPNYHNASTTAGPTGTVGLPSTSSYPPYPTFNNASTTASPTGTVGLPSTSLVSPSQGSSTSEYCSSATSYCQTLTVTVTAAVTPTFSSSPYRYTPHKYTVKQNDVFYDVAQAHGLTVAQLEALNPQVADDDIIQPGDVLTIKPSSYDAAPNTPNRIALLASPSTAEYTVKGGDQLIDIAHKHGLTLAAIQALNPQMSANYNMIQPGQVLSVGPSNDTPSSVSKVMGHTVTVKEGDTLSSITDTNGVSLEDLTAANPNIASPNSIVPGQRITLPESSVPATNSYGTGRTVTVKPGDTLRKIAAANSVSLADLKTANPNITNPDLIYPGETINIPRGDPPKTYTIKKGDTLNNIASSFGTTTEALKDANPQLKANPDLIHPGQVITVPNGGTKTRRVLKSAKFRAAM